jgi:hypothetical protein
VDDAGKIPLRRNRTADCALQPSRLAKEPFKPNLALIYKPIDPATGKLGIAISSGVNIKSPAPQIPARTETPDHLMA